MMGRSTTERSCAIPFHEIKLRGPTTASGGIVLDGDRDRKVDDVAQRCLDQDGRDLQMLRHPGDVAGVGVGKAGDLPHCEPGPCQVRLATGSRTTEDDVGILCPAQRLG